MRVAVIDYGMGNLNSVQKALKKLGIDNIATYNPEDIAAATHIILPGVGSFKQGMENIRSRGLDVVLTNEVIEKKKPFLGICLGMQLIVTNGTEPEPCKGLGWIEGEVIKINAPGLRIPHLGWNNVMPYAQSPFYNGISNLDFYFIHSYHFKLNDNTVNKDTVDYGIRMNAAIHKENIFATQFHPEKSQDSGMKLLNNFFSTYA